MDSAHRCAQPLENQWVLKRPKGPKISPEAAAAAGAVVVDAIAAAKVAKAAITRADARAAIEGDVGSVEEMAEVPPYICHPAAEFLISTKPSTPTGAASRVHRLVAGA